MTPKPAVGWFGDFYFAANIVHAVRDADVRNRYGSFFGTTVCGRQYAHVENIAFDAAVKRRCKKCADKIDREAE